MWALFNLFVILNFPIYINPFVAVTNYVESDCYEMETEGISFRTSFFTDDSGLLTIQDVRGFKENVFKANPDSDSESGKTYWVKLSNEGESNNVQYLLQLNDLVDRIDIYMESDSIQPGYSGGIGSTLQERKVAGLGNSTAYFEADKTSFIFAKIKPLEGIQLHLNTIKVSSFQVFLRIWMRENTIQIFFIGILFVFFIVLFILSGVFKQKYQLYFSLFLLSVCLQWLFIYNLSELITGNLPRFELFMNWMVFPVQIFVLLFVREYFELKTKYPGIYQIASIFFIGQLVFASLAITTFFMSVVLFGRMVAIFDIVGSVLGLAALIFLYKDLNFSKKLIFVGLASLLTSNIIFILPGYFTGNHAGHYYLQISIILVLLAIVAALALEAFEFLTLFQVQKDSLNRITLKSESLEIEYHLKLAEITEQERLLSARNLQLAQVSEIIKDLEVENPILKRNHELSKWKEISAHSVESWKEFDSWFNNSNELFFKKLHLKHPDLSINDRRLCGFLKHDMSTKDMAELMRKSTNTIDVARYRLRHKLGLGANVNINNYLLSIENDTTDQFLLRNDHDPEEPDA